MHVVETLQFGEQKETPCVLLQTSRLITSSASWESQSALSVSEFYDAEEFPVSSSESSDDEEEEEGDADASDISDDIEESTVVPTCKPLKRRRENNSRMMYMYMVKHN